VQEDRAAATAYARTLIVVKDDQHVIQSIMPPQRFSRSRIGVSNPAIVVPVGNGVAPAVGQMKASQRQTCARARTSIWAIIHAFKTIDPGGGGAITLAFDDPSSAAAECAGKGLARRQEDAAGGCPRKRPHKQLTSWLLSHHFPDGDNLPLLATPGPIELTVNLRNTAPVAGDTLNCLAIGLVTTTIDTERT
jgi:hypothetical protein